MEPSLSLSRTPSGDIAMIPGELLPCDGEISLNEGAERYTLHVANTGDRPIQVGSHYHFAETNPALRFDRDRARGWRLDLPGGTPTRLEPGTTRTRRLLPLAGGRIVHGFRGYLSGKLEG